jgi:hypothetical protein
MRPHNRSKKQVSFKKHAVHEDKVHEDVFMFHEQRHGIALQPTGPAVGV